MKGRPPQFTAEEIARMRDLYNRPHPPMSAPMIARLFRCSPTTVLRAVEGTLAAKDAENEEVPR